jgi:hypothetical protein
MRKLIFLILTVIVVYSGYWLIGARTTERGITAWLGARQADGWQAEYTDLTTNGYPINFHTVLRDLALADPASGIAYQTSQFEIKSRSFTPTRIQAKLAQDLRVLTPFQTIDITNSNMDGTLFVEVGPALTTHQATFNFAGVSATSSTGWGFTLADAKAQAIRDEDTPLAHNLTFSINDLKPSSALMSRLNPNGILSDTFDSLNINAKVTFDKNWDITALEGPRPQPKHVLLRKVSATWGALNLNIAGNFSVDERGYPNGKIQIQATNWREMISLATAAGVIPQNMETIALRAGEMLAKMKGNENTIDAELSLSGGAVFLGFIPLGPVPRLTIR